MNKNCLYNKVIGVLCIPLLLFSSQPTSKAKIIEPVTDITIAATSYKTDGILIPSYTFNGDEGQSTYRWLMSDKPYGVWHELAGETEKTLMVTNDLLNKYIRFEVTPVNDRGVHGVTLTSTNIVQVQDGTWTGNPNQIISQENPYLNIAINGARYDIILARNGETVSPFWLAWAYCAPESPWKGNTEIYDYALQTMNSTCSAFEAAPVAYWDILFVLESVYLFKRYSAVDEQTISNWLNQLQASVEANYTSNLQDENTWMNRSPNTLHQSAAILQLAYILYGEEKYSIMARDLVRKTTEEFQYDDGAFAYIRNSAPAPVYYNFDATFLGRYYQLSRDENAKMALIKMAKFSTDILGNGLLEGSSAPWWKKEWGTSGPFYGAEIIAGVSKDPLTRSIAQYRLSTYQRYHYVYYSMYFWDPTIPITEFPSDLIRYNSNIGGPQLRNGDFQVLMPGRAYGDTAIGCSRVSNSSRFGFDGYLETAALPILGANNAGAYDGSSAIMNGNNDIHKQGYIVGEDWIASAKTFRPLHAFTGNLTEPGDKGWDNIQIWYADKEGLAGWIDVEAYRDISTIDGPKGLIRVGHAPTFEEQNKFISGNIKFQVFGETIGQLSGDTKDEKRVWLDFNGAGRRSYTKGEKFGYGLSATKAESALQPTVASEYCGDVLKSEVITSMGEEVTLIFNPTEQNQTYTEDYQKDKVVYTSDNHIYDWSGHIEIQPYELIVIKNKVEEATVLINESELVANGTLTGKILYKNNSDDIYVDLIVALYERDDEVKKLKEIVMKTAQSGKGKILDLDFALMLPSDVKDCMVKIFAWENGTLRPLAYKEISAQEK